MTTKQQYVLDHVLALRQLTRETGCVTARSQSRLLATLNDAELTEVSYILSKETQPTLG
jgi:hypothetical protein